MLQRHEKLSELPTELRRQVGGFRLDRDVSLLWAAYWRTQIAFNQHRPVRAGDGSPFEAWLPNLSYLELVAQHQVAGLMALTVVEFSKLKYTVQVAWNRLPDASRFCPAWCIERRAGGGDELRLRPIATIETLSRLVARYARRKLIALPSDVDAVEVVFRGPRPAHDLESRRH